MAILTSSMVLSSPRMSSHLFPFVLFTGFSQAISPLPSISALHFFFRNALITYYEVGTQGPHCHILIPSAGGFLKQSSARAGAFCGIYHIDRWPAPLSRFHTYVSLSKTVTKRANLCRPLCLRPVVMYIEVCVIFPCPVCFVSYILLVAMSLTG